MCLVCVCVCVRLCVCVCVWCVFGVCLVCLVGVWWVFGRLVRLSGWLVVWWVLVLVLVLGLGLGQVRSGQVGSGLFAVCLFVRLVVRSVDLFVGWLAGWLEVSRLVVNHYCGGTHCSFNFNCDCGCSCGCCGCFRFGHSDKCVYGNFLGVPIGTILVPSHLGVKLGCCGCCDCCGHGMTTCDAYVHRAPRVATTVSMCTRATTCAGPTRHPAPVSGMCHKKTLLHAPESSHRHGRHTIFWPMTLELVAAYTQRRSTIERNLLLRHLLCLWTQTLELSFHVHKDVNHHG